MAKRQAKVIKNSWPQKASCAGDSTLGAAVNIGPGSPESIGRESLESSSLFGSSVRTCPKPRLSLLASGCSRNRWIEGGLSSPNSGDADLRAPSSVLKVSPRPTSTKFSLTRLLPRLPGDCCSISVVSCRGSMRTLRGL